MTPSRRGLLAALCLGLTVRAPVARAQFTVFDPSNYAENVLQAARSLEAINNQVRSLQNEAQMLVGQARNLTGLPFSSLAALQAQLQETRRLLGEAQGLAFDVEAIQAAFRQQYGAPPASMAAGALTARADQRWSAAVSGFQDALKVQAGVVGGLSSGQAQMRQLVEASQGAVGALQAAQAGNQLLALQSQQLAELLALNAAQGRAQALEAADRAAARADAKARFARFMGRQP